MPITFPIRRKIQLGLGAIAVLVVLVAGLSINALTDSRDRFDGFVNGLKARADTAEAIRTAVDRRAIAARNMALVTPSEVPQEHADEVNAQHDVDAQLDRLKAMVQTDGTAQDRALLADIDRIEGQYKTVANRIVDLALSGHHDEAVRAIDEQCRPLLVALVAATQAYATYTHEEEARLLTGMAESTATHRNWLVGLSLLALAAATGISLGLARALTRPVADAVGIAQTVAQGDLTSRIEVRGNDETRDLLDALHSMNTRLTETVQRVRASSDHVQTAAREIAAGNADLSRRTESQAVALQEAAASMNAMTQQVRQTTDAAQQARHLANDASSVAGQGQTEVERVAQTMKAIDERSTRIADITGIIESIAFQTNILALNAAVEAARAGEQGRGFAVVAGEVRTLAQRSDTAAKEIKDLIARSADSVRDGTRQVEIAQQTMGRVTASIERVSVLMGDVAGAAVEQSAGLEQINQTIGQMDDVTQQNTALVEEAAAASRSLEDQGHELNEAVGFFRLTKE